MANDSVLETQSNASATTEDHTGDRVIRRTPNLLRKEPRPTSVHNEEPLLDPQLAAMLEARKIKAGESPGMYRNYLLPVCYFGVVHRYMYKVGSV